MVIVIVIIIIIDDDKGLYFRDDFSWCIKDPIKLELDSN